MVETKQPHNRLEFRLELAVNSKAEIVITYFLQLFQVIVGIAPESVRLAYSRSTAQNRLRARVHSSSLIGTAF